MSAQPGDSSVKCQHAMQINCGLGIKIWATGTFKHILPCASNCHLHLRSTSAAMWFDRPSWLNSLSLPVKWRSQALLAIICTDSALLFRFSTHIWAALCKAETTPFLHASSPSPQRTAQYVPPRAQRGTGGLCALLHEACLLFTFALISCSLSHHGAGDPRHKAATWGNNAGFSGFRCPLRRL